MADIVERLRDSDTTRRIGESYADVHDRRQADRNEAADEITRLTAENEKLRDVLSGVLWMADEWFNHGGDETAFSDDHAAKLEAARAAITQETRDD
jgi:regulator of replication initiation timing